MDEDGIPDFFQHEQIEDPHEQRQVFRNALRTNRDAQAIALAGAEVFEPNFPGYREATFKLKLAGVEYSSLDKVPVERRKHAQRVIVELLRRRAENGGEALTVETVRLSDSGVPVAQAGQASEPPSVEESLPADLVEKIASLKSSAAVIEDEPGEFPESKNRMRAQSRLQ
jgi:hypothetical protein